MGLNDDFQQKWVLVSFGTKRFKIFTYMYVAYHVPEIKACIFVVHVT